MNVAFLSLSLAMDIRKKIKAYAYTKVLKSSHGRALIHKIYQQG